MFRQANQYATVVNFAGVRIKDERQDDSTHLVEFAFESPFTPELAEDISGKLVADFFDKTRDGFKPKAEINQTTLTLETGLNRITVRAHETDEIEPIAVIENATIRNIRVKKAKAEVFLLSWVISFAVDLKAVAGLIANLKQGVYVTLERLNPKLALAPAPSDSEPDEDSGVGQVARAPRRRKPAKAS